MNKDRQELEVYSLASKDLLDEEHLAVAQDEVHRKLMETVAERNLLIQEPSSLSDRLSLEQRSFHHANLAGPEKESTPC